jgi:glycosyltransferase involved in cell wall biosynthesis
MKIAILGLQEFSSADVSDTNFWHLQNLLHRLADRGHELVVFVSAHDAHLFSHSSIQCIIVPNRSHALRLLYLYLRHIKSVDVVHVLSLRQAWLLPILSIFFPRIPRIIDIRQCLFEKSLAGKKRAAYLVDLSKNYADQIIVPFRVLKQIIFAQQSRLTHFVPDSLDIASVSPPKNICIPQHLRHTKYLVLDVSHPIQSKLLIKAIAKHAPMLPVICIGQSIAPEILDIIQTSPCLYTVQSTRESEINAYIAHAYLYIHTQKNPEHLRLVRKSLMFGTPVLGPESVTLRELFGRNYLAYISGNYSSILNLVYFALDESELLHRMSHRALLEAKENLSLEGNVNRLIYIWANAYRSKEIQHSGQAVDVLSQV